MQDYKKRLEGWKRKGILKVYAVIYTTIATILLSYLLPSVNSTTITTENLSANSVYANEELIRESVSSGYDLTGNVVETRKPKKDYSKIISEYKEKGSPLNMNAFVLAFEEQGFSYSDIEKFSAIMAWESGWGKSYHCQTNHQCMGYGIESKLDRGYHFESFEEFSFEMAKVLKKTKYAKAPLISFVGVGSWNSADPKWLPKVSEIKTYFN